MLIHISAFIHNFMNKSIMYSLKFTVYEDGQLFSINEMTEPESAAISECVHDLFHLPAGITYWPEVDVVRLDDDEASEGVLRFYTMNPEPKSGSLEDSRTPHTIPAEVLAKLTGKRFHIQPPQYGLSPWGKNVELVFEGLPVTTGMRASDLIAAALEFVKKG